jgi:16S rRNA G966 N2-methylase RsmD
LFNVLTAGNPEALEGTVWLDLFAGTGAVGIEALSRGARHTYFVETSAPAAKLIEQNLQSLGIAEGYKILRDDLAGILWRTAARARRRRRGVPRSALPMQRAYEETLTVLADSSLVWAMTW